MQLGIMQPYLFPYIGYFQLISVVDKFIILDDVNYIKKGWINRNNILLNGKSHLFTLPLKDLSQNKLIKDLYIENNNWQSKFIKTLQFSYKKAPFYSEVIAVINDIIKYNTSGLLTEYINNCLVKINKYIGINTTIVPTSTQYKNGNLKGQDRIIDICLKEKTTNYINPIGGIGIYDRESFNKYNIKLNFIKSNDIIYKQFDNDFIPSLSIIDIMMFNSTDQIIQMLGMYQLL